MTAKEKELAKRLGTMIREHRKRSGMNQTEFGKKLGCGQALLSKIENGESLPSVTMWFDFCQLVKISADSFRQPDKKKRSLAG
jgi:transcriptional regulator with XRE-family HTH domain